MRLLIPTLSLYKVDARSSALNLYLTLVKMSLEEQARRMNTTYSPDVLEISSKRDQTPRSVRIAIYVYSAALIILALVSFYSATYATLHSNSANATAEIETFYKIHEILSKALLPSRGAVLPLSEQKLTLSNVNDMFTNLISQTVAHNTSSHLSLNLVYLSESGKQPEANFSNYTESVHVENCQRELVNSTHFRLYLNSTRSIIVNRKWIFFFSDCDWK